MKTLTHNITLSLLLFFFIVTSCKKDDNNFQEDNATLKLLSSTSVPAVGYNIENSLPKGYVKDGSKDYTSYIQDAVKKYDVVNFPKP
jgi:hypothetical protein